MAAHVDRVVAIAHKAVTVADARRAVVAAGASKMVPAKTRTAKSAAVSAVARPYVP